MGESRPHVLALFALVLGTDQLREIARAEMNPRHVEVPHVYFIFLSSATDPCARLVAGNYASSYWLGGMAQEEFAGTLGMWINVWAPEKCFDPDCDGYVIMGGAHKLAPLVAAEVLKADDSQAGYCVLLPESIAAARFPEEYALIGRLPRRSPSGVYIG